MAVEKLASGRIFVGAPYRRTAAENYVSLFTKSRLEEFERAQKDARDETELKKLEYKAQLAAYQERIKSSERYRAKLMDLRTRTENKEFDDATALQKLGAIQGEKYAGRVDAQAKAEGKQVPVVVGSTTTTTSSGGFGGGGGGAPKLPDLSPSSGTQQKLDTIKGQMGSAPSSEAQVQAIVRETGPQGMLTTEDPNDRRKAVGQVTERLAKEKEGQLVAAGIDPAVARSRARDFAKSKALEVNPALAADIDQYYADVDAVASGVPTGGGGGGGGTRVSTSDRDVVAFRTNPNLPDAAVATPVNLGPATSRQDVIDAINKELTEIPVAGDAPAPPVIDPFTRGRSLYAQRFGPTVPVPAYAERNLTRTLLDLPPEMQAQIGASYREYLAQQAAAEAPTTPTVPTEAAAAPPTAPAAEAPEAAPARFGESGMGETFPYESEIVAAESGPQRPPAPAPEAPPVEPAEPRIAPTAPPAPPAPAPYVEDAETTALRKQAMAAVQAREVAAKKAELQALIGKRAADRATVDALLANVPSATPMPEMPPMAPPPAPERRTLPQFTPPEQRAAPVNMPQVNTADARKRALELAALGMKPEGALMQPTPAAPSTAMAAPKQAAKLDLKGPGPLASKTPEQLEAETDAQVLAASEVSALTKSLVEDEKFRERVLRSKPGEFAAKVYRANREANKPLGSSQNTVVDEYMGSTKDMKTALAVVYALDALSKPTSPVKAMTPTKRVPFGPQE